MDMSVIRSNVGVVVPTPKQETKEDASRRQILEDDKQLASFYLSKVDSCRQRRIDFNLTLSEVDAILQQKVCYYTGERFTSVGKLSLSLERINPLEGYTPNNVVAVTSKANTEKSTLDAFMHGTVIPDEMKIKILRKMVYQLEKKVKNK